MKYESLNKYGDFYRIFKKFDNIDLFNLYKLLNRYSMTLILIRGGEPFIYKDRIYKIINIASKKIKNIILLSNGSLINKYDFKFMYKFAFIISNLR